MLGSRFVRLFLAGLALFMCTCLLQAGVSPLTPTPAAVTTLSYQKPSNAGGTAVAVALQAATTATYFTVDPTTVPVWLSLDTMSGTAGSTAGTAAHINFSATALCASLGAGVYSATVNVLVLNQPTLGIPVTLTIKNAASTLSVVEGTTHWATGSYAVGDPVPSFTMTLASSNEPIAFTLAAASTATTHGSVSSWLKINHTSGTAYTWGTPIAVTFDPLAFMQALAGDTLAGTVTITAGAQTIPVAFNFSVTPPVAHITSLYPATVPVSTAVGGTVSVVLTGTGFITSPAAQQTVVDLGGAVDAQVTVTPLSSTAIMITIPTDATANYFGVAGSVTIGVYNPTPDSGGNPTVTADTGTKSLTVTTNPIISSITSASAFIVPPAGSNPTVAPYDVISIFGSNFCTNCGGANPATLSGTLDSFYRFSQSLSPDSGTDTVKVHFNKHGAANVADGYILFASNTQINVLVPSLLGTQTPTLVGTGTVDVVVEYGPSGSTLSSSAFVVNVAASDPGIFTVNSTGQGQGAILHSDYTMNGSGNKATKGTTVILIFMTGLGAPTSTASNATSTSALAYPGSCISALGAPAAGQTPAVLGYKDAINNSTPAPGTAWTTVDGAVIQSAKIASGHFAPCLSGVTLTINGTTATVAYAGWVMDSVAGLYQVQATVPASIGTYTAGGTVPVQVTVNGVKSQVVTMYMN